MMAKAHKDAFDSQKVSEEKIKMWKVNQRRMPSDGKSSQGCIRLAPASDKDYQELAHGPLRLPPPLKLVAMI